MFGRIPSCDAPGGDQPRLILHGVDQFDLIGLPQTVRQIRVPAFTDAVDGGVQRILRREKGVFGNGRAAAEGCANGGAAHAVAGDVEHNVGIGVARGHAVHCGAVDQIVSFIRGGEGVEPRVAVQQLPGGNLAFRVSSVAVSAA